jgi:hypothetical protein
MDYLTMIAFFDSLVDVSVSTAYVAVDRVCVGLVC